MHYAGPEFRAYYLERQGPALLHIASIVQPGWGLGSVVLGMSVFEFRLAFEKAGQNGATMEHESADPTDIASQPVLRRLIPDTICWDLVDCDVTLRLRSERWRARVVRNKT